jgi:type IV pilus assembly protein PilF
MCGKLLKAVRRRPWRTAGLLSLLLASAAAGLYAYAHHQWQTAQAALAAGQIAEARRRLKVCLFVWPRSVPVQLLAARAARLNGDFPEAEARLHRCLKLQSNDTADIELEFLLLRVQGGEIDAVERDLWQCVEQHHPQAPLILETMTHAYLHDLRCGPALVCLERWMQEAPEQAQPYYWHGWIFERLGDRTQALEDYRQAVARNDAFVPARLQLVELYLRMSNAEEALPHLERLAQQCPDHAEIQARLGHCRFLQGQIDEARRLLEAAVEKLPNDIPLLIQLGRLENQQGHPREAEQWLRRALELDPTDPEAQHLLANSLQAQGRSEEADAVQEQRRQNVARSKRVNQWLREAAQHPLTDPNALFEIGHLFLQSKQEHLGLYWLHQALEYDPSHQPTLQALADYYEKIGQAAKAAAYRRKLKRLPSTGTSGQERTGKFLWLAATGREA